MEGVLWISKRVIAARSTETITTRSDVALTIWVERGRVDVLDKLGGKPIATIGSPGPVSLVSSPTHLQNKAGTLATVFVAAYGEPERAPRPVRGPLPQAAPAIVTWNVFCSKNGHGLLNEEPLSRGDALDLQASHIDEHPGCKTRTKIREA
jgi:hypothetical protein